MNDNRPIRFDVSLITDAVSTSEMSLEGIYFNTDFAVLNAHGSGLFNYLLKRATPLIIHDYRMGLLINGEVCLRINLIERHVTAGTMLFIGPGTIIEPIELSSDIKVIGLGLFHDLPFMAGRVPPLFNGSIRDFMLPVGVEQQSVIRQIVNSLWVTAKTEPFSRDTFDALSAAMMQYYNHLYSLHEEREVSQSHDADIFNRFIELVNGHARKEHKLGYYADRMCLTQRYLGSVVRKVSSITAKEWIDRALITEAKVLLLYSDKTVSLIADELEFPSATFFSKYFRRLTGQGPADYRKTSGNLR